MSGRPLPPWIVLVTLLLAGGGVTLMGPSVYDRAVASLFPTATPTPSPTPTSTATATPSPSPTPTVTPTPQPPIPTDHLWLRSPIGPGGNANVDRFYPYGSTGGGTLRIHHGVEFQNPLGVPVVAAAEGTVIVAGTDEEIVYGARPGFYGNLVIIQLDQDYRGRPVFVLYAHLSSFSVEAGQRVAAGDSIGAVGMTGGAFGPHLHFEIRVGTNEYGSSRNPELWLAPGPAAGVIAGRVVGPDGTPVPEAPITIHPAANPGERWGETVTYPHSEANPDDDWKENFAAGSVPAGEWLVVVNVAGQRYRAQVLVEPGNTTFVEVIAGGDN